MFDFVAAVAVRDGAIKRRVLEYAAVVGYEDSTFDVVLSTLFFHHLPDDAKRQTAAELVRVLHPGRLIVVDLGRPQDLLMRFGVRMTVQILDGVATTALNVRGELADVLAGAGLRVVTMRDRVRTPTGTYEVITAAR